MTQAIAIRDEERPLSISQAAMKIQEIVEQKRLISQVVKELMKEGEHYGKIPGAPKPSLWKPGADLLCSLFQLEADYEPEEIIHEPGYIYYRYKCVLKHIPTGKRVGAGLGSCNSREEKYVRAGAKKCPSCEKETIFRSKPRTKAEEANPDLCGWYCWSKKGGCGKNFVADDPTVVQQDTAPKDPSDLDNTILKMAGKRSRIDAVLTVTGASDFFTQDLEDLTEKAAEYIPPPKGETPPAATSAAETTSSQSTAQAGKTSTISPGQTTETSKRPRADQIKHDGKMASHKQVALLHIVRSKAGLPDCKGDCMKVVIETKKWGKESQKTIFCEYHTKLSRFKDQAGKPISTSTALSSDQISFFIDWCEQKAQRQDNRAEQGVDLDALPKAAALGAGNTPTTSADVRTTRETAATGGDPYAADLDTIRNTISEKEADGDESLEMDILSLYGVNKLSELAPQHHPGALAMAMAWGTGAYLPLRQKIASQL